MIREPAIFTDAQDELMGTVANKAIITELFNWMNLAQLLNVRKVQFFFLSNAVVFLISLVLICAKFHFLGNQL